jgi:hypothetical protein
MATRRSRFQDGASQMVQYQAVLLPECDSVRPRAQVRWTSGDCQIPLPGRGVEGLVFVVDRKDMVAYAGGMMSHWSLAGRN